MINMGEIIMYKTRCDLYRYVTYRKDEVCHISYANAFNYSNLITGLTDKDKLGEYHIELDRSTGMIDKSQKMIFQNDYVKNNDGKVYLVEWCQDKLGFVSRTDNPDDTLESLDITSKTWSVVGNIHTKKYKEFDKK